MFIGGGGDSDSDSGADASGKAATKKFTFSKTGTITVYMLYDGVTYALHFTIESGPKLQQQML